MKMRVREGSEAPVMVSLHRNAPFFAAWIDIDPHAKERPRVNRKTMNIYTPKPTAQYERALTAAFKELRPVANEGDDLFCQLFFHVDGFKRKDKDNLEKCVLDAGNKVLFADDSQVVAGFQEVLYGVERPGIQIEVSVWREASEVPARSAKNARSKPKVKRTAPLPAGYDVCPTCLRKAKMLAVAECQTCTANRRSI